MKRINNTDGRPANRARLTNGLVNKEGARLLPSGRGEQRKMSRRVKRFASWVAMYALLFRPCVPAHGGLLKGDVDFSNYDVPLFEQIVNRIKAKVAERLEKVRINRIAILLFLSLTKTKGIARHFRTHSSR
jgi:hypothetical protein